MLLIYTHNTRAKTGFIVTEDLIAPAGGRYKPISNSHPQAHLATEVMTAMSRVFLNTDRRKRLSLKESYEAAVKADPTLEGFTKYLSATATVAERILIK